MKELDGFVEFTSVSVSPKNDAVPVVLEHLEGFKGKGHRLANRRIFIFNDSPVKIYGYKKTLTHGLEF